MRELQSAYSLPDAALGHLTSAVQFGFIAGTMVFALLAVADRFSPSRVFFCSAFFGALANMGMIWTGNALFSLLLLRFITGFFLAGIYPVGMKIAADYYNKGLGTSLGYLVGALVLGTAFPHLLKSTRSEVSWKLVLEIISILSVLGGIMILLLPDGPFRKRMQKPDFTAFFRVFSSREFRSASFGYFGHMWELYAFWAFVPLMLNSYRQIHPETAFSISLWSFLVIGIGGPACVFGGYLSRTLGVQKIAKTALLLSGICCLICPWAFSWESEGVFLSFLLFWGMVVIADSPLFSTLVARNATAEQKGTALTIVTSIGFAITIASIQGVGSLLTRTDSPLVYSLLALGPLFGLLALRKSKKKGSEKAT